MPYPHSQRPSFAEFKRRLIEEYECKYQVMEWKLGLDFRAIPYFARQLGQRILRAVAYFIDDEIVEFSDIRRICRALEVPPAAFGLELEGWYDMDPEPEKRIS